MAVPQVMTPREIVSELDRYIVGQHEAKRAVAIALRNRWRRQNVAPELRDEIAPKKYFDDRTDRRRQDRNCAAAGAAGAGAVRQGGSVALHGGRLRRARRRVDDPRPGGNCRSRWCATKRAIGLRSRRARMPRSDCSTSCSRPRPKFAAPRVSRPRGISRRSKTTPTRTRARNCASCSTAATWTIAKSSSKSPRTPCRISRSSRRRAWKRWAST